MENAMANRMRIIKRLANTAGLELRKHRWQVDPDTSWDLLDPEAGAYVFSRPARGFYGVGLDEVG
jgi:hypothetical protein